MPKRNNILQEYVRTIMKEKGLNGRDIERDTGGAIDSSYLSKIVNGTVTNLTMNAVRMLARGLDVDVSELYYTVFEVQAFQFYSCFISYCSIDETFVDQLYLKLQQNEIKCWYAPEDLKIGNEIRASIDQSIRIYNKLLIVLSKASIKSQWVQQEVETALARERQQQLTVVFPIRLDNTVMSVNDGWPAYIKNTRHIGDFTKWRHSESFNKAFRKLLRDLKSDAKT
ncbi:MAG: TIR domain-containing protein [Blastocatellia bacterium]